MIAWLGVARSKFYAWTARYGKANEHNGLIPRDFWLESWEREAIIGFALDHPLEGYRRLTFMMLDRDIVAVSPSSTWRVLAKAGLLKKWNRKNSAKGNGFVPMNIGISMCRISISAAPFIICAACSTAAAVSSFIGRSGSR